MTNYEVIPLNEGYYTIGFDKIFYPFNPDTDVLEDRSRGSLLVEIQPFLIKTPNQNILIDSGLGFKNEETGELKIAENLKLHGFEPDDITDVVMSHLHKDHAGGLLSSIGEDWSLNFENAVHHINHDELLFAVDEKNKLSYDADKIIFLKENADIHWFDNGHVFDFMSYTEDGGHCPYHTSFLINLNGKKFFFGGDVTPQLKQLKFKYMAKYDFDAKKSSELRSEYAEQGKKENWTFLFYHDVSTPMAGL